MKRPALPLFALLALSSLLPGSLRAQSAADSAAVHQVGMNYLDLFYLGDESLLDESIHTEVFKYGFYRSREATEYAPGEEMTREAMREFAADVRARDREPNPDWPKSVEILDLSDQIAVVKVFAWWGFDYLTMARVDGRWQIMQVLWQSYPPRG